MNHQRKINSFCIAAVLLITGITLHFFGRNYWCPAGDLVPWSFDLWSQHNSQHLMDWYTPSHISHGLLFYILFRVITPPRLVPYSLSFAVFFEAAWEILENSTFVIERYREATIALDYFGDSILNSLSDIGWCAFGFFVASHFHLKLWQVLLLFVGLEILTLIFVRDNLILNVIMLIHPVDSIKAWQMPG